MRVKPSDIYFICIYVYVYIYTYLLYIYMYIDICIYLYTHRLCIGVQAHACATIAILACHAAARSPFEVREQLVFAANRIQAGIPGI